MVLRWAELAIEPEDKRFNILSQAMNTAGVENQVEFVQVDDDEQGFAQELSKACEEFAQLRFGGRLAELVTSLVENLPAETVTFQVADAFVHDPVVAKKWWPRCFLAEGFRRTFIVDIKKFDLSGAVFILGASAEAKAAVGAFSRMGFKRFSVADPDDDRGQSFVETLERRHFGVKFDFVPRTQVTQLPAVHSVAINTLPLGRDEGMQKELFYFNFLKAGGVWLDMCFNAPNFDLETEARSVGAVVANGSRVAAWTDVIWAKEACGAELDQAALHSSYLATFQPGKR